MLTAQNQLEEIKVYWGNGTFQGGYHPRLSSSAPCIVMGSSDGPPVPHTLQMGYSVTVEPSSLTAQSKALIADLCPRHGSLSITPGDLRATLNDHSDAAIDHFTTADKVQGKYVYKSLCGTADSITLEHDGVDEEYKYHEVEVTAYLLVHV
jgi:hypothetical protein